MNTRNELSLQAANPRDRRAPRDPLDELLAVHFDAELSPQLGLAAEHFEKSLQVHRRWRRCGILLGGAALAASLLLALTFVQAQLHRESPAPSLTPGPVVLDEKAAPLELERSVAWRTVDDGTVLVDDAPMRQIRREVLERVQYYDPARNALVEMVIPREETFLVSLNTY